MNFSDWASVLGAFILIIVVGLALYCLERAESTETKKGVVAWIFYALLALGVIGAVVSISGVFGKFMGDTETFTQVGGRRPN
jgi:hypothetical protein